VVWSYLKGDRKLTSPITIPIGGPKYAEHSKEENLSLEEMEFVNTRISKIATEVDVIDEQSRKLEDREIIE
jgi:hypothetical protein